MNTTTTPVPLATQTPRRPLALFIGGGIGLVALGALATALVLKAPSHEEAPAAAAVSAPVTAPADMPASAAQVVATPAPEAAVETHTAPKPVHKTHTTPAPQPTAVAQTPAPAATVPVETDRKSTRLNSSTL